MKSCTLFSVLFLTTTSIAQQKDASRGPYNILPNGVVDGVAIKDEVPVRSAVEYEFVRSSDLVWNKRVFSRIDAREKINHEIFFPFDFIPDEISSGNAWEVPREVGEIDNPTWIKHAERYSLWTIIMKHIFLGDLRVYDVSDTSFLVEEDGYKFKYPVNPSIPGSSCKGKFFVSGGDGKYRNKIIKRVSSGSGGKDWPFQLADGTDWQLKKTDMNESAKDMLNRLKSQGEPDFQQPPAQYSDPVDLLLADPELFAKFEAQYAETQKDQTIKQPLKVKFITSASITAYNIKEDWFFDKERSLLDRRIIAIAPIGRYDAKKYEEAKKLNEPFKRFDNFVFVNDRDLTTVNSGVLVKSDMSPFNDPVVELELFWLYFPELRNVMVNYYIYNDQNDSQWMSFDDMFWKRRFNAQIYRVSDKFDREIEDYKFGVDALYEAERIKEQIREWEINVWNY